MTELTLYPAIDLLGGHCERLRRGNIDETQVFDADPVEAAQRWQAAGATWLHVVDLDGALTGTPHHLPVLRAIVEATGLPVQAGGGLRDEAAIERALEAGAARVLLGTAALRSAEFLTRCVARWGERIAVSVDSRGGRVTVAGWLEMASVSAAEFAARMASLGVRTLVLTNVEHDGTLAALDASALATQRRALPTTRLIIAGGIATLDDIRLLALTGMDGVVLGRALYENALDLTEALRLAREIPTIAATPPSATPDTPDIPTTPLTTNMKEGDDAG